MMALVRWFGALLLTVPLAYLGFALARDPGRVTLRAWGWQIDTTLVLALMLISAVVLILALAFWLLWRLPLSLLRRRQQRLRLQFRAGLEDLANGRWRSAQKRLTAAASGRDFGALSIYHASIAAQQAGASGDVMALSKRLQNDPQLAQPSERLRMESQFASGDISQLGAQLDALRSAGATDPQALQRACSLLMQRGRALDAVRLIQGATLPAEARAGLDQIWGDAVRLGLEQASTSAELDEIWRALSGREQALDDVLARFVLAAARLKHVDDARSALCAALSQRGSAQLWDAANALLQAQPDLSSALAPLAERARTRDGETPELLTVLAHCAGAAGRSTDAAALLDRALSLSPQHPPALRARAQAAYAGGDLATAAKLFHQLLFDQQWETPR